jgi:hypothetical protein
MGGRLGWSLAMQMHVVHNKHITPITLKQTRRFAEKQRSRLRKMQLSQAIFVIFADT